MDKAIKNNTLKITSGIHAGSSVIKKYLSELLSNISIALTLWKVSLRWSNMVHIFIRLIIYKYYCRLANLPYFIALLLLNCIYYRNFIFTAFYKFSIEKIQHSVQDSIMNFLCFMFLVFFLAQIKLKMSSLTFK